MSPGPLALMLMAAASSAALPGNAGMDGRAALSLIRMTTMAVFDGVFSDDRLTPWCQLTMKRQAMALFKQMVERTGAKELLTLVLSGKPVSVPTVCSHVHNTGLRGAIYEYLESVECAGPRYQSAANRVLLSLWKAVRFSCEDNGKTMESAVTHTLTCVGNTQEDDDRYPSPKRRRLLHHLVTPESKSVEHTTARPTRNTTNGPDVLTTKSGTASTRKEPGITDRRPTVLANTSTASSINANATSKPTTEPQRASTHGKGTATSYTHHHTRNVTFAPMKIEGSSNDSASAVTGSHSKGHYYDTNRDNLTHLEPHSYAHRDENKSDSLLPTTKKRHDEIDMSEKITTERPSDQSDVKSQSQRSTLTEIFDELLWIEEGEVSTAGHTTWRPSKTSTSPTQMETGSTPYHLPPYSTLSQCLDDVALLLPDEARALDAPGNLMELVVTLPVYVMQLVRRVSLDDFCPALYKAADCVAVATRRCGPPVHGLVRLFYTDVVDTSLCAVTVDDTQGDLKGLKEIMSPWVKKNYFGMS